MNKFFKKGSIAIIGPSSSRFKGGIAHFTSTLAEKMSSHIPTLFYSWYCPYPKFLTKRNFEDKISKKFVGTNDSIEMLGYMNPFSWIKTVRSIQASGASFILFTWVHPIHSPVYLFMIMLLKLVFEKNTALICHNVEPHEKIPFIHLLSNLVFKSCDTLIVHSTKEAQKLALVVSPERIISSFHPIYEFPKIGHGTQLTHHTNKLELLFFGIIRDYKGLDLLLEALSSVVKTNQQVHLTIAGECFTEKDEEWLRQQVNQKRLRPFVSLYLHYIPNEQVGDFFQKTDALVLPYRSATSSGPLTIAYHFGKPVLATNVDGLPEYVEDGKSGYLMDPTPESISKTILHYYRNPLSSDKVRQVASKYTWEQYVVNILSHLKDLDSEAKQEDFRI